MSNNTCTTGRVYFCIRICQPSVCCSIFLPSCITPYNKKDSTPQRESKDVLHGLKQVKRKKRVRTFWPILSLHNGVDNCVENVKNPEIRMVCGGDTPIMEKITQQHFCQKQLFETKKGENRGKKAGCLNLCFACVTITTY